MASSIAVGEETSRMRDFLIRLTTAIIILHSHKESELQSFEETPVQLDRSIAQLTIPGRK